MAELISGSWQSRKNEFILHYEEENSLSEAQGGGRGKEKGILFTLALKFNNNASNTSKVFGLASITMCAKNVDKLIGFHWLRN